MAELVAKRYSNALFEIAKEENKVDVLLEEVQSIISILDDNKEFMSVINHPHITSEDKGRLLKETFESKVDSNIIGLFQVVLSKNREEEILSILENFVELAREYQNITTAVITTAVTLSASQIEKIVDSISKSLNKKVEYETVVDKNLIGGLKIAVDGKVFENSVRKTFEDLKKDFYVN